MQKNTIMKKTTLLLIATILFFSQGLYAQKIYELDEVKQIPYIDEYNMKTIAFSIYNLYLEAITSPESNSTNEAVEDTVFLFYDTDWDGVLNKLNPLSGKKYSNIEKSNLEENNILLFNLTFNPNKSLIIPEKLFVISYRKVEVDLVYKQVGLLAFELTVSDSLRTILKNVKLYSPAAVDKNSLSGGLSPVKVLIPFNLRFGNSKFKERAGTVIKRDDFIDISLNMNQIESDKSQIIESLKINTDLMQYKKGRFQFVMEENKFGLSIDVNIGRDAIVRSQPKSFSSPSISIKSFTGKGKKYKN